MKQAQKIIKYLAIGFGIVLSVGIVGAIVSGIAGAGFAFSIFDGINSGASEEIMDYVQSYENISNLEIDVDACNIEITKGENFKVEAKDTPTDYEFVKEGDTLKITSKDSFWGRNFNGKIVVYVPSKLNSIELDIDAGTIAIEDLEFNKLKLDSDAGKTSINNVKVISNAKINSNAGEVAIENSEMNNLDLENDVGSVTFNGIITGQSTLDTDVGEIEVKLDVSQNEYTIYAKKDIGKISINGVDVEDNYTYGNGKNVLKVESSIGKVSIETEE